MLKMPGFIPTRMAHEWLIGERKHRKTVKGAHCSCLLERIIGSKSQSSRSTLRKQVTSLLEV